MNLENEEDNINVYRREKTRIESFVNWPYSSPMKPAELARAGFFYTGIHDTVQCAFCKQILGQWSPGDTAFGEHYKFSPQCPFLNTNTSGNIPYGAFTFPVSTNPFTSGNVPFSPFTLPVQESQGLQQGPVHINYNTLESRLQTFVNYPRNKAQTPLQLAEAGFFSTGDEDNVQCYFCDGGLKSWDPVDNPWTEHARWFPHCEYLKHQKGQEFIDEVKERFESEASGGGPYPIAPQSPPQVALTTLKQPIQATDSRNDQSGNHSLTNTFERMSLTNEGMEIQGQVPINDTKDKEDNPDKDKAQADLKKTIQDLEEERMCKICMDEKANVVFLECGHLVCCEQCATQVRTCPMCRQVIIKIVKTYIS